MMERRTLLGTSAAATIAASASVTQAAPASDNLMDVKIDPWNQPPELLKSRYQRLPKQDDEARQHFTRGLAKFVSKDYHFITMSPTAGGSEEHDATAEFLRANGESMTEPTKLDMEESFRLMLKHPPYAARIRLTRTNFFIHWDIALDTSAVLTGRTVNAVTLVRSAKGG